MQTRTRSKTLTAAGSPNSKKKNQCIRSVGLQWSQILGSGWARGCMSCSWISSWQLWGRWGGDNLNPSSMKHHCCPKHLPPPLQADQLFLRLHNTAIDLSSHPFQCIHSSLRLPSGPFLSMLSPRIPSNVCTSASARTYGYLWKMNLMALDRHGRGETTLPSPYARTEVLWI